MRFNWVLLPTMWMSSAAMAGDQAPAVRGATVVSSVEKHYSALAGFQAKFTQTVASEIYGDDVQTGSVQFQKPGKMHWTFAGDGKEYVADGTQMWVYVPADKQVYYYPTFDASGSAQSLLHSLGNLDALYTVTVKRADDTAIELALTPKIDGGISAVTLQLAPNFDVRTVVLLDNMNTRTELVFSDLETNPKLDDAQFQFVAPDGVTTLQVGVP